MAAKVVLDLLFTMLHEGAAQGRYHKQLREYPVLLRHAIH